MSACLFFFSKYLLPGSAGGKFYLSETKAKQALKDKQKFILEAREKRKKPPKTVDPKEYAEDVRTRKPGVGLKKISTITKDNVVTKTYKDRATGKVTKRYSSKLVPGEFKSFAAAAEDICRAPAGEGNVW